MRSIKKGAEPPLLVQHRKAPGEGRGTFDNLSAEAKTQLREHLVREQGHLCAYCMKRIEPSAEATKIEHIEPQSYSRLEGERRGETDYARQRGLEYTNLLAVCDGGSGKAAADQHCDTRKGDTPITLNPADPTRSVETLVRYSVDGSIVATNPAQQPELDDVLGLNLRFLRDARAEAVTFVMDRLAAKQPVGTWTRRFFDNEIATVLRPNAHGKLRPYLGAVLFTLERRRARTTT